MAGINLESYDFVASENNNSNSFEPLPEGWYTATIDGAELRQTKAGTGDYIALIYTIAGPSHVGRKVWGNLNIRNPNSTAERIGREQLSKLSAAIGLKSMPQDTDQLIGFQCQIRITIRKSEQYGDGNEVKDWKAASGGSAAPQPTAQAPANNAAPWARG
jgi:hypothetical protein